jgi:hypothetical protein
VVKVLSTKSMDNFMRVYFKQDTMLGDALNFWGNNDVIIQPFIRQRHPCKPSLLRYYMKSNQGVYKAYSLSNSYTLDKEQQFYRYVVNSIGANHKNQIEQAAKRHAVHKAMQILRPAQVFQ